MIERILIVGFGSIGQRHLRVIKECCPRANFAVLNRSVKSNLEGHTYFATIENALAFKPQVAIIATPAPFHIETALTLALNGCHLLIEKPLSVNSAGVIELLRIARQSGVVLQVGYNLRYLPSLRQFRTEIKSNRIGRVLSIRAEVGQYLESWRPGSDYRSGVSAKKVLGGGVLLELSHEIDYLRWIFGEVNWVSAWTGKQSKLDIDVEDTAHLLLGFKGQEENSSSGPIASLVLDCIRHDTSRRCTAICENGTIVWDAIEGTLMLTEKDQNSQILLYKEKPSSDYTYIEQWNSFSKCIINNEIPIVNGSDGLATLNIIESARESDSMNSQRVKVSYESIPVELN
jgi:predicted dehydrogenase